MFVTDANPGKYNDLCTHVRKASHAAGAIVIVVGGDKGEGFSVQGDLTFMMAIPKMLRRVADEVENDNTQIQAAGEMPK